MAKSADAFRTISEVAEWLEVPAHVLRFWESKFAQVKPVKRAGGRRYYRPADIRLLAGIKHLLHDKGMTIKGVQKLLREQGVRHVSDIVSSFDDDADALEGTVGAQVLSFTRNDTPDSAASKSRKTAEAEPADTAADGSPTPEANPPPLADSSAESPPAHVVTADPPDDIAADPGPIALLAALPRPIPASLVKRLEGIASALRARDSAAT